MMFEIISNDGELNLFGRFSCWMHYYLKDSEIDLWFYKFYLKRIFNRILIIIITSNLL